MHPARANSAPVPAGTASGCQVEEGTTGDTGAGTSLRQWEKQPCRPCPQQTRRVESAGRWSGSWTFSLPVTTSRTRQTLPFGSATCPVTPLHGTPLRLTQSVQIQVQGPSVLDTAGRSPAPIPRPLLQDRTPGSCEVTVCPAKRPHVPACWLPDVSTLGLTKAMQAAVRAGTSREAA